MGIFKSINWAIKEVTGVNELEREKALYQEVADEYNSFAIDFNKKIAELNNTFEEINNAKKKCVDLINLYGLIDKRNRNVEMERLEECLEQNNFDINKITASGVFSSIITGGVLSYGAYTAVSIFGIASTGTPIALLSGVAATNATLAALGGGALAVGGGGMAMGTAVLGILAVIPTVIISFRNYSKAGEIERLRIELEYKLKKLFKVEENIDRQIVVAKKFLTTIENAKKRYNEKMQRIVKEANETTKKFIEELKLIDEMPEVKKLVEKR